jgi:hypothetical protein
VTAAERRWLARLTGAVAAVGKVAVEGRTSENVRALTEAFDEVTAAAKVAKDPRVLLAAAAWRVVGIALVVLLLRAVGL